MRDAKGSCSAIEAGTLKVAIAEAKAATETRRLAKELDAYTKLLQPAKRMNIEMGNAFHSFAGFRKETSGQWVFNVADGLRSAASAAGALAGYLGDTTVKALHVSAAGEKAKRAFQLNIGEAPGKDVDTWLGNVSDASRGQYTKTQLRDMVMPAVQQGYQVPELKRMLATAFSVKEMGRDPNAAISAITGIRQTQSISTGTLEALGFGSIKDQRRIAKRLGGVGRNVGDSLGVVSQQMAVNPEKAKRVTDILFDEIQKREGGKLGNFAAAGQNTQAATLERLANLPTLLSERLASNGSLGALYKSLDRFAEVLAGPPGREFADAIGSFIGGVAKLVGLYAEYADTDKARIESGFVNRKEIGGGKSILTQQQDIDDALTRHGRGGWLQKFMQPTGDRNREGLRYIEQDNRFKFPMGSEAEQFGYSQEVGAQQARLAERANAKLPTDGSADDFIWRNGRAIEINPNDSIMGFKRGGSLGAGEGGGGSSGAPSLTLQFGDVYLDGKKTGRENADGFMGELEDRLPASWLLSALEQFADDAGA